MFLFQTSGLFVHEASANYMTRLDSLKKAYPQAAGFYPGVEEDILKRNNAASQKGMVNREYVQLLDARIDVTLRYLEECRDALKRGAKDTRAVDKKYADKLYAYDDKIKAVEAQLSAGATSFVGGKGVQQAKPKPQTGGQAQEKGKIGIKGTTTIRKEVMPISKVNGFYDWMVSQLANQTGKGEDEIKSIYTKEEVNRAFRKSCDYIAGQSGNRILPKDWEEQLIGGKLTLDAGQLAIAKTVCALWLGRTQDYARQSFDAVLKAGDANAVLLAIYDNAKGVSKLAGEMKDAGREGKKYWGDIVFKKIMQGVKVEELKKQAKEEETVAEVPGTQNEYSSLDAFSNDWRTKIAIDVMDGAMSFRKAANGKYSVPAIEEEAARHLETGDAGKKQLPVPVQVTAAGEDIKKMTGITSGNAIETMKGIGVLQDAPDRKKLRQAGLGGNIARVDKDGGKMFYALSKDYLAQLPVDAKNIAMKIASGDIGYGPVQAIVRERVRTDLIALGVVSMDGAATKINLSGDDATTVGAYLNGGELTDQVKAALNRIVEEKTKPAQVQAYRSVGALIALEAKGMGIAWEQTSVGAAIVARCDLDKDGKIDAQQENALFDTVMLSIKATADANGNLDKEKVIAAINGATPAAQIPAQAAGEMPFNPNRHAFAGFAQGPLGPSTPFYRDIYDAFSPSGKIGLPAPLYYMTERRTMLPYYGEIGAQRTRRAAPRPAAGQKQEQQVPPAPAQQAAEVKFSTGTWVDDFVKGSLPQEYNKLTDDQKQRVQKVIQDLVQIAAVEHNADRALDVLMTAIDKVNPVQ